MDLRPRIFNISLFLWAAIVPYLSSSQRGVAVCACCTFDGSNSRKPQMSAYLYQGEIMMITTDYSIYHMPCGDLCVTASTCLAQAEDMPTYEVSCKLTRFFCFVKGAAFC